MVAKVKIRDRNPPRSVRDINQAVVVVLSMGKIGIEFAIEYI
jgi:hypothetical protein